MNFKIYIEGAGPSKFQGEDFRQAWQSFFRSAGLSDRLPAVVRGGSRSETYDKFTTSCAVAGADYVPLLLVDSEGPVEDEMDPWTYLRQREADQWRRPHGARLDSAFLMVQLMETWFLADPDGLERFFGPRFIAEKLKSWPSLERVEKATVLSTLEDASRDCGGKRYAKGRISFDLLRAVNAKRVEERCPRAKALLQRLRIA